MDASVIVELPDELREAYETANRAPLMLGVLGFLLLSAVGVFCLVMSF